MQAVQPVETRYRRKPHHGTVGVGIAAGVGKSRYSCADHAPRRCSRCGLAELVELGQDADIYGVAGAASIGRGGGGAGARGSPTAAPYQWSEQMQAVEPVQAVQRPSRSREQLRGASPKTVQSVELVGGSFQSGAAGTGSRAGVAHGPRRCSRSSIASIAEPVPEQLSGSCPRAVQPA